MLLICHSLTALSRALFKHKSGKAQGWLAGEKQSLYRFPGWNEAVLPKMQHTITWLLRRNCSACWDYYAIKSLCSNSAVHIHLNIWKTKYRVQDIFVLARHKRCTVKMCHSIRNRCKRSKTYQFLKFSLINNKRFSGVML